MAAIGVARLGDQDLLARGGRRPGGDDAGRRVPAGAGRGPAGGAAGGRGDPAPAHRATAERLDAGLRRLRPRPSGAARGAVRAGQRLLRDPRRPARGRGRRRPLPGHLRRRPLQPAGQPRSADARSRTRTWSTSPTGCRCGSGSQAGSGSTSPHAESRASTAWSSTCAAERSPGDLTLAGRRRAGGRAWCSAGSSACKDEHLAALIDHVHGRELVGHARGPRPGWTAGWSTRVSSATAT